MDAEERACHQRWPVAAAGFPPSLVDEKEHWSSPRAQSTEAKRNKAPARASRCAFRRQGDPGACGRLIQASSRTKASK